MGIRGKTEKIGSRVRETGVTSLTLASLPALQRLKHGKQQKMRRRDIPLTTHGETLTYTLREKKKTTHSSVLFDHVTVETSRLGCCPDKPGRNDLD